MARIGTSSSAGTAAAPAPTGAVGAEARDGTPALRASAKATAILLLVAAAVLAADAITKYFVVDQLTGRQPVRVLGGLVYLDLIRNSGAAFSLLSNKTWVFTLVAAIAVGWIGWLATKLRSVPWAVALGLILGGALGNLVDRVFRAPGFLVGHVVDYISLFEPYGRHFAIFNLADAMLCAGIGLAILLELTGRRRDGTRIRRKPVEAA